ncbi:MAG: UpxY family transcription antiterminator [Prevotella sp.]|nr:UpxY family transcription antiterminator [Prevotella sp.]
MDLSGNLQWFPMRVTYNRELKIKESLDELGVENFIPMHYELVDTKEGRKRMLVPAIHNLIFVHSTQEFITHLKMTRKEFEPLRYIIKTSLEKTSSVILRVPDQQMENFMRVATVQDESVMFLDYKDFIGKEGRRVRINEGSFAGVEGTIKRIKKNKHVVVQIEGVAAVAITFVPSNYLSFI